MEVKVHLHLYLRVLSWELINCIYFQSWEQCFCEPVTVQNHQWFIHGILTTFIFLFIALLCAREKKKKPKKKSQAVLLCFSSMDSSPTQMESCKLMENDEDAECKQAEQLSKQRTASHGNRWRWQIRRQKTHQEKENWKSVTDWSDTEISQNF